MDVEPKYSFVVIPGKNYPGFNDKNIRNLIDKWFDKIINLYSAFIIYFDFFFFSGALIL